MATDLIVAPREAAETVAAVGRRGRQWPDHRDSGLSLESLMLVHAHLDGEDPDAPKQPRTSFRNPFTGEEILVTRVWEWRSRFEPVAGHGDDDDDDNDSGQATYVCSADFVARMARLDGAALDDLASRWLRSAVRMAAAQGTSLSLTAASTVTDLHALRDLARQAIERGHALFVWSCDYPD